MTVVVSFVNVLGLNGGAASVGVGRIRAQERVTVPGTTTAVAAYGEAVVIGNGEGSMVAVALGTTPDAAATSDNGAVTTAGFPVGPGQISPPFMAASGAKVNIKVVT